MVFGVGFKADPKPAEVREVSVISAQDFAALVRVPQPPATISQPAALPVPDVPREVPDIQTQPDDAPQQAAPVEVREPEPEVTPEVIPTPPPIKEPEVASVPEPAQPEPPQPTPPKPVLAPTRTPRPPAIPVDRIASVPVPQPPPDTRPDEVVTPEVIPEVIPEVAPQETPPQEVQEATAPQEAADHIVTEAEQVASLAPLRSVRPPSRRPAKPAVRPAKATPDPAAEPTPPEPSSVKPTPIKPTPAKPTPDHSQSVNQALAELLAEPVDATPSGPPLSQGEKDALRVAVSGCWNVGSLSTAALAVTVVVGVSMSPEGKPDIATIRLLDSSGGTDSAVQNAFATARRAIIKCAKSGYQLPAEKYEQWREIEMTFNPERMRVK